jgi:hypothetical protein
VVKVVSLEPRGRRFSLGAAAPKFGVLCRGDPLSSLDRAAAAAVSSGDCCCYFGFYLSLILQVCCRNLLVLGTGSVST